MSSISLKRELPEQRKFKTKMSKPQMQQAIVKKKECDAKALAIVEQLLEPNVNSKWLLNNLGLINKTHMEDVIEERAIIKLCGYVLCNKALTRVIAQQFYISTKKNKVYDVTRRKNFCSSHCYGACNYLLEQMLTSPLWLRKEEEIPAFKFLTAKDILVKSTPGEEILLNIVKDEPHASQENLKKEIAEKTEETIKSADLDLELLENHHDENCPEKISHSLEHENINAGRSKRENQEKTREEQSSITSYNKDTSTKNINRQTNEKIKSDKSEIRSTEFYTISMHIEQNIKEWITDNTLCLLLGEESLKNRLLENVNQHDKYLQLCQKLNKLQLVEEKSEENLARNTLKPLPHLSVLREEGKKIELKVRAFYKGTTSVESAENSTKEANDYSTTILPLTDAHAPKALRRRIFLDKLNRILPDLFRALAGNTESQYTRNSERTALIRALVNTFSLSAGNIIFKTAEWTLVGLIIIKMLSIIDPQLKVLLGTRQATMYTSMILMAYKLDSNYLERLIIELTNDPKIFSRD